MVLKNKPAYLEELPANDIDEDIGDLLLGYFDDEMEPDLLQVYRFFGGVVDVVLHEVENYFVFGEVS